MIIVDYSEYPGSEPDEFKPHPIRIQRKRLKGWRMPPNTKYVGRGTKWGNPFPIGSGHNRNDVIELYRSYLFTQLQIGKLNIHELKGKNLACFCKLSEACHADILLKLANS